MIIFWNAGTADRRSFVMHGDHVGSSERPTHFHGSVAASCDVLQRRIKPPEASCTPNLISRTLGLVYAQFCDVAVRVSRMMAQGLNKAVRRYDDGPRATGSPAVIRITHDADLYINVHYPFFLGPPGTGFIAASPGGTLNEKSDWSSLFFTTTWNVTDSFRINAGARYQDVSKDGTYEIYQALLAQGATAYGPAE
jgi:hypothetical protein